MTDTNISLLSATFDREQHTVHVHAMLTGNPSGAVPVSMTFDWHHPRLESIIREMAEGVRAAVLDAMAEALAAEPMLPDPMLTSTPDTVHPCRACREPVREGDGVVIPATGPHESDRWYHRPKEITE